MNPLVVDAKHHEPQQRNAAESVREAERRDATRRDRRDAREAAAPLLETVQQRWDGTIGPLRDLTFVPLLDLGDRFLPDAPQQELAGERRFVRRHEMRRNFARAPAGD